MPKLVKKVVVVKRPVTTAATATSSATPTRTENNGNNDDDDSNHASPPPQQQQQPEVDPTMMPREELEHAFLELRAELAAKDRIIAKLTTEVTLLRRIQLQHDREQHQQQQPSRTRSVVVVRTAARSKSAAPRQQQRVAGPEIYAAAEELRRQGFGMTAETVAAAAQEQQQKQLEEQPSAAAATSSSEPLLSCSECHQQLPKSEFSSSQAKKLVGRKCKQCVVKVAEIEAQLRAEAAANLFVERIRIASEPLLNLEQSQRQVIADEERASHLIVIRDNSPSTRHFYDVQAKVHAFLLTRKWPESGDPRRPLCFHKWLFSIESADDDKVADWIRQGKQANPDENAASLLLRDLGLTLSAVSSRTLYSLMTKCESSATDFPLVHHCVKAMRSLVEAGALKMPLPPTVAANNGIDAFWSLFQKILDRNSYSEIPSETFFSTRFDVFGSETSIGAELLSILRSLLQHAPSPSGGGSALRLLDEYFFFWLNYSEIARAYKHPEVARAFNELIRFMFIADGTASHDGTTAHPETHSRCYVARLLGLCDNNLPADVVRSLMVALVDCHTDDPSNVQWFELVADLVCNSTPSVVASLLQMIPNEARRCIYSLGRTRFNQRWTVVQCLMYRPVDTLISATLESHRDRAIAAAREAARTSTDPLFTGMFASTS